MTGIAQADTVRAELLEKEGIISLDKSTLSSFSETRKHTVIIKAMNHPVWCCISHAPLNLQRVSWRSLALFSLAIEHMPHLLYTIRSRRERLLLRQCCFYNLLLAY